MDKLTMVLVALLSSHAHMHEADNQPKAEADQRQVACVTEALYFEARGEGVKGMVAVADVIDNRTDERGMDLCEVVHEKGQFTYKAHRVVDRTSWELAAAIAEELVLGHLPDITHGATYYHANAGEQAVHPEWADRFRLTATIGQHSFYSPRRRSPQAGRVAVASGYGR